MPILFYPGQEDYITELNKLAAIAELTAGAKGWSPLLLPVEDGLRLVLQISGWTGGEGVKPATGQYLALTGLTSNISQATDIRGTPGNDGTDGTDGTDGAAATIAVGTVSTGAPGSSAVVTNSGTSSAAVFDFTLPQGPQGAPGADGTDGADGTSATVSVGTVSTVAAGSPATVTNSGTSLAAIFDFEIPQGPQGNPGTDGADGIDGAAATIAVGTVTTGAAGSSASVTNAGTSSAAIFNFTIPRGVDGTGSGDVTGPASATAGHVAVFSDSTGKELSDGGALGTAAFSSAASFATASQGALADSAVQPEDLATVATSGSYNDLTSKPTIPAAQVNSDWNAASGVAQILNKPAVIAAGANQAAARAAIGAIADAPSDGKTYGRKDGAWVEGGGNGLSPGDVLTTARTLAAPNWLKCDGSVYLRSSYPAVEALLPYPPADGVTWTQRTLPSNSNWQSVTYGNGVFVAVASGAIAATIAATSPDGITWTQRTLPTSANWQSVTYGNGVFVAVAYNSTIAATSPNGITWTQRTLPTSANWQSVTYGNGVFVAVAYNSTIAATSPDGVTWTQRTLPSNSNWQSVTYGNGVFVAVAYNSTIAATSFGDPTKFLVPQIADPVSCRTYIKATT